jgi:hypothetical protein
MPSVQRLLKLATHEKLRIKEGEKADRARLRKLKRAGDWKDYVHELWLQNEELTRRFKQAHENENLRRQIESLQNEIRHDELKLILSDLDRQQLKSENEALRAQLGYHGGIIPLDAVVHTPVTICEAIQQSGQQVSQRTVINWLCEWRTRRNKFHRYPMGKNWRFENNKPGRQDIEDFLDWCQKHRKLRKNAPKKGA